jgi:hypothetical protein
MHAIDTTRTALRRSRASAAALTWYYLITILQSHNEQKYHVKMGQNTTHAMNWLTSVIDRLANFSSRFAWPFP